MVLHPTDGIYRSKPFESLYLEMSGPNGLDIIFVINKSDTSDLKKDGEILEEGIKLQSKICGVAINSIKWMDQRETPLPCDICIHFEIPCAVWFSWARMHCMLVNPKVWVDEWNGYSPRFSQWIFKTQFSLDMFIDKLLCTKENSALITWRAAGSSMISLSETAVLGWVWVLDNEDKMEAAKQILPLWKEDFQKLVVYTPSPLTFDVPLSSNITIKTNVLTKDARQKLLSSYSGHVCLSTSDSFGYSAAEAEQVGAFTMLNTLSTYTETYGGQSGITWLSNRNVITGVNEIADFTNKNDLVSDLRSANMAFKTANLLDVKMARKEACILRNSKWDKNFHDWFLRIQKSLGDQPRLPRHLPPILNTMDCPPISIITLIYGRPKFLDLAFHNLTLTDYPRDKIEWVIVDDSSPEESGSDKIIGFEEKFYPGKIRYVPLPKKTSIGRKRNIGCRRAAHEILLMMDDDDHYPQTSLRRRVAWLVKDRVSHKAAVCTNIALYDLQKGVSAVNVPPFNLSIAARSSEATLTFTRDFWLERPFPEVDMAEGEAFLKGRESDIVEMPPQQIIIAFSHGKNISSRKTGEDGKVGCFWGFPRPFLEFVHSLAGVTIEEDTS